MSGLALFSLVGSEVTVGTICQPRTAAARGGPGFVACRWMVWKYSSKGKWQPAHSLLLWSQPGFGEQCSWR